MGIKLDMQKAYDRVEWDFLDAVMERMGFCSDKFAPSRGLKQGDPLSPYLFILLGEVISCIIQAVVDDKRLEGVRIGVSGPIISHMCYEALGQKVNLQKSSIYFGANVLKGVAANLGGILGMSGRILGKFQGWKQSALSRAGREVLIKAVVQAIPAYPMSIF
ncbi:hypothetical protein TB2_021189 [Malus domestica]